jgi:hypothetical protein
MVRNGEILQALYDEKKKSLISFAQQEITIKKLVSFEGKT